MSVDRRNAVVTGAGGALGRAFAVRLAREGRRLALVDLDAERNAETAAAVVAAGGEASCVAFDVADLSAWQDLANRLRRDWSRLDLLINNAGIAAAGCVGEMPPEHWRRVLDVNLLGVVHGCHTLVPWLKQNRGSQLINIASFAAFVTFPEMAAYNTAKAGVTALTETLRAELAEHGVGVTLVCPGFFLSGLARDALMLSEKQRDFTEATMRAATITADDVAGTALSGAARNKPYVVLPARARRYWRFKRFFPGWFSRRIADAYRRHKAERDVKP